MIKGFSEKRLVLIGFVVRRERIAQSESFLMRYNASILPPTESLGEVRRFPSCLLKLPSSLTLLLNLLLPVQSLIYEDRVLAYTSKDYTSEINV